MSQNEIVELLNSKKQEELSEALGLRGTKLQSILKGEKEISIALELKIMEVIDTIPDKEISDEEVETALENIVATKVAAELGYPNSAVFKSSVIIGKKYGNAVMRRRIIAACQKYPKTKIVEDVELAAKLYKYQCFDIAKKIGVRNQKLRAWIINKRFPDSIYEKLRNVSLYDVNYKFTHLSHEEVTEKISEVKNAIEISGMKNSEIEIAIGKYRGYIVNVLAGEVTFSDEIISKIKSLGIGESSRKNTRDAATRDKYIGRMVEFLKTFAPTNNPLVGAVSTGRFPTLRDFLSISENVDYSEYFNLKGTIPGNVSTDSLKERINTAFEILGVNKKVNGDPILLTCFQIADTYHIDLTWLLTGAKRERVDSKKEEKVISVSKHEITIEEAEAVALDIRSKIPESFYYRCNLYNDYPEYIWRNWTRRALRMKLLNRNWFITLNDQTGELSIKPIGDAGAKTIGEEMSERNEASVVESAPVSNQRMSAFSLVKVTGVSVDKFEYPIVKVDPDTVYMKIVSYAKVNDHIDDVYQIETSIQGNMKLYPVIFGDQLIGFGYKSETK